MKDNKFYMIDYRSKISLDQDCLDIGLKMINSFTVLLEPDKPAISDDSNEDNDNESKTFKINPKDVTFSSAKAFKWYDWDKAPEDLKIAAGFITTYKNTQTQKYETLKSEILQNIESNCKVRIASVDLDEDGICSLAVSSAGSACCGTSGCMFELFDNGGVLSVDLRHTDDVNPVQGGVKAKTGRFFPSKILKRFLTP